MSAPAASALSPKEVAQQLGFCTKTVLSLIKRGELAPVYRINKRVIRVPQEAVDRYLKACTLDAECSSG